MLHPGGACGSGQSLLEIDLRTGMVCMDGAYGSAQSGLGVWSARRHGWYGWGLRVSSCLASSVCSGGPRPRKGLKSQLAESKWRVVLVQACSGLTRCTVVVVCMLDGLARQPSRDGVDRQPAKWQKHR